MANLNLGDAHRPDKVCKFADLPDPVTQSQAAKLLNVSPRIVADAKEIQREAVKAGATLAELGRRYQITMERVRQIARNKTA